MSLEIITTCVGYDDYLTRSLSYMEQAADRVVVATTTYDLSTRWLASAHPDAVVLCLESYFHADGAPFAKGRAIRGAMDFLSLDSWVAVVDADVVLFDGLPNLDDLDPRFIYGMDRVSVEGEEDWTELTICGPEGKFRQVEERMDRRGFHVPLGYFQLWHFPTVQRYYSICSRDASRCDIAFARRWRPEDWRFIEGYQAYHLKMPGDARAQNWRGRTTPRFACTRFR